MTRITDKDLEEMATVINGLTGNSTVAYRHFNNGNRRRYAGHFTLRRCRYAMAQNV